MCPRALMSFSSAATASACEAAADGDAASRSSNSRPAATPPDRPLQRGLAASATAARQNKNKPYNKHRFSHTPTHPAVSGFGAHRGDPPLPPRDTRLAMSQENVEFAKRGIALWNRGDMDALRERTTPRRSCDHPPGWPEPGPSVGLDAIFDQFRRLREDAKIDQLEMTVLADPGDWIVWEYRWTATGLESGLPMELVGAQATRYSAGQIVEVRFYADRAEALEAVGLRE